MSTTYLLLKTFHLVAMVAWFAGLFYLVRIFVYHAEANDENETKRDILQAQFDIMGSRLHRIIILPAMLITWGCGIAMVSIMGGEWFKINNWLHTKMLVVIFLSFYSLYNGMIIKKLSRRAKVMSPYLFRLYNEVPTLFLLFIILLAVFRNMLNFGYAFLGIVCFAIVLMIFARIYKQMRTKR